VAHMVLNDITARMYKLFHYSLFYYFEKNMNMEIFLIQNQYSYKHYNIDMKVEESSR
jgi:hypothetical protein